MPTPLIVFDLDGTLVDSHLDLAETANDMLQTYGRPPLSVPAIVRMVGEGARVLVERALVAAGLHEDTPGALERFLAIYDGRLLNHTVVYPGLMAMILDAARRVPLAVLTNKPERHTSRILEALGLAPHFRWVIGGDSAFPRKPDPAGLSHLVAVSGATSETTLLVGDSGVDVETARRAGTRVAVALYGFSQYGRPIALQGDEYVAQAPQDVQPVIERFLDEVGSPGIPDYRIAT